MRTIGKRKQLLLNGPSQPCKYRFQLRPSQTSKILSNAKLSLFSIFTNFLPIFCVFVHLPCLYPGLFRFFRFYSVYLSLSQFLEFSEDLLYRIYFFLGFFFAKLKKSSPENVKTIIIIVFVPERMLSSASCNFPIFNFHKTDKNCKGKN